MIGIALASIFVVQAWSQDMLGFFFDSRASLQGFGGQVIVSDGLQSDLNEYVEKFEASGFQRASARSLEFDQVSKLGLSAFFAFRSMRIWRRSNGDLKVLRRVEQISCDSFLRSMVEKKLARRPSMWIRRGLYPGLSLGAFGWFLSEEAFAYTGKGVFVEEEWARGRARHRNGRLWSHENQSDLDLLSRLEASQFQEASAELKAYLDSKSLELSFKFFALPLRRENLFSGEITEGFLWIQHPSEQDLLVRLRKSKGEWFLQSAMLTAELDSENVAFDSLEKIFVPQSLATVFAPATDE